LRACFFIALAIGFEPKQGSQPARRTYKIALVGDRMIRPRFRSRSRLRTFGGFEDEGENEASDRDCFVVAGTPAFA
jgi:hypothetical protein